MALNLCSVSDRRIVRVQSIYRYSSIFLVWISSSHFFHRVYFWFDDLNILRFSNLKLEISKLLLINFKFRTLNLSRLICYTHHTSTLPCSGSLNRLSTCSGISLFMLLSSIKSIFGVGGRRVDIQLPSEWLSNSAWLTSLDFSSFSFVGTL